MNPNSRRFGFVVVASLLLAQAATAGAQSSASFAISRFAIASGGASGITGGSFGLAATTGQPFTSSSSGGAFSLTTGFLAADDATVSGQSAHRVVVPVAAASFSLW